MSLAFIPKSLSGGAWRGTGAGGWGPFPPGAQPPARQRSVEMGWWGGLAGEQLRKSCWRVRRAVGQMSHSSRKAQQRERARGIVQTSRPSQLSKTVFSWPVNSILEAAPIVRVFRWILIFTPLLVSLRTFAIWTNNQIKTMQFHICYRTILNYLNMILGCLNWSKHVCSRSFIN